MTLHTEDEAKKLWCPMSRMDNAEGGGGSYNRFVPSKEGIFSGLEQNNCIASGCAMWQEEGKITQDRNDATTMILDPYGYCGLIRRP